eukprot:TRINITY_DN20126_c0_g1_i1.p2 TRINITY_DN20126_c0_g1~~TRINITY_DN20126_c0_g1_i1.p2  ORF type:complete len:153 (+),score=39.50 TRINITY_DN20126_c0_g1_i1:64-522(+)
MCRPALCSLLLLLPALCSAARTVPPRPKGLQGGTGTVVDIPALEIEKVASDREKDVVVIFIADWCKTCRRVMPAMDHAAAGSRNDWDVIWAKSDVGGSPEIMERMGIEGLPTVRLYPAGKSSHKPLTYDGDINDEAKLKEFLQHNRKSFKRL